MRVVVLQSNYLPWKGYFDLIHDADAFVFYDEVKYTKNDWRNRNRIYSKNGLQWITIPIAKDAVKLKISEVSIDAQGWQDLHFDSLYFAYKRAPFFAQLEGFLVDFYKKRTWGRLSELNQHTIIAFSEFLGIKTRFLDSANFSLKSSRLERLIDLLKQVGTTEYISGPSAKGYLEGHEHLFEESGIKLTYKDYAGYPPYQQLKSPFENSVSIVDLIANIERDLIPDYIWRHRTASHR